MRPSTAVSGSTLGTAAHLGGLRRTLRHLGILAHAVDKEPLVRPRVRHMTRFVWLRTPVEGWWEPSVEPGREVRAGMRLGAILDPFGEELATIGAPESGVVMFQTASPAVRADGLLLALAGGEAH